MFFFLCYTLNATPTLQTRDAKKIKGNIMQKADRDFLVRADRVSENYQHRIRQLAETIADTALSASGWADLVQLLERCQRLEALQAEHEAHTARVKTLRQQRHHEQAINKLCAEANKLAGTDGANFFTQAGKIFDNYQEKTPDE